MLSTLQPYRMSGSAGGLSVLDATAENMHNFAQGSFELVVKDLEAFCWEESDYGGTCPSGRRSHVLSRSTRPLTC